MMIIVFYDYIEEDDEKDEDEEEIIKLKNFQVNIQFNLGKILNGFKNHLEIYNLIQSMVLL